MFAKIFGTPKDQILVLKQEVWESDDKAGEIRVFIQPYGLGVCSLAMRFSDTEQGWENREYCFRNFTEDVAQSFANMIREEIDNIMEANDSSIDETLNLSIKWNPNDTGESNGTKSH